MEMTTEEASQLVGQLQIAHRLSVGFYQRLLPLLTRIAEALEFEFWYWEPCHNDKPCQSTTPPKSKWAWDFVPLYASRHVYRKVTEAQAREGDLAVVFNIYLDDSYKPDNRKKHGIKGQPDPITMPTGAATVEICLYHCDGENGETFQTLWYASECPSEGKEGWEPVGPKMSARLLTCPLERFIAESDTVIDDLRNAFSTAGSGSH